MLRQTFVISLIRRPVSGRAFASAVPISRFLVHVHRRFYPHPAILDPRSSAIARLHTGLGLKFNDGAGHRLLSAILRIRTAHDDFVILVVRLHCVVDLARVIAT